MESEARPKSGPRGRRATNRLPALQAGDSNRGQVGGGLYVRADSGGETAAEVGSEPDLFLSAMRSVAGHGLASRRGAEYGGLGHDSRSGERGTVVESGGMGRIARDRGAADFRER